MSESNAIQIPDTPRFDLFLTGVKAAASAVPLVGGSIAEVIGYSGQVYTSKRVRAFYEAVLRELEHMHIQVDALNESYFTALAHAAQVVTRTAQQEKIEALKNAAVNAATPTAPGEDSQHIFLSMVDDLTPLHLRLLGFIAHPEQLKFDLRDRYSLPVEDYHILHALDPQNPRAAWDALEANVPGSDRRDLVQLCFNDMINRGLLEYRRDLDSARGTVLPWPTNLAWEFLGFISSCPSRDEQPDAGAK